MPRPRLRIAENAHTSARRAHPIGYDGLFQIDCSALLLQPVPEKVVASARMSRMRSNRRLSASECNGSVSQEVRIPPPRLRVLAQFRFQMQKFESSRPNQPVRKKVEMRFAHLKTHHRFERMRLRGLSGARDEFHLAAVVQNLKTLANRMHQPTSLGSCPHHNPQREQYSESERCSDRECVHFVPSHHLRAPPGRRPGHPYAIESATIAAGVVSLTGLPNWSQKRTNYGIQFHPSSVGLQ
jgi:hypothetical protein